MPFESWLTFLIATFIAAASPGPTMLHMMSTGVRHGFNLSIFTMVGCGIATLGILTASALGLGALLEAAPAIFDVVRYLGVVYLIYLGVSAWRAPASGVLDPGHDIKISRTASPLVIFWKGFMVGISNPKLLAYATAIFTQFIDKSEPKAPQLALLLATFAVVEASWYVVYATWGTHIAKILRRETLRSLFNRFVGSLFIGLGLLLLRYKPG